MEQDAKSLYGLVGYPVAHSLSPLMHNAAFKALELNCEYRLFPLKEDELEEVDIIIESPVSYEEARKELSSVLWRLRDPKELAFEVFGISAPVPQDVGVYLGEGELAFFD